MRIIGWDIGGAHLKAALVEDGRVVDVVQLATPTWQGLDTIGRAIDAARQRLGPVDLHAATMTAELSDAYPNRAEGVAGVAGMLRAAFAPEPLRIYGGRAEFLAAEAAASHAVDVASANWHASAALVGRALPDALFVDMGSTTTDVIPVHRGAVAARGYTDAERLASGELVYTGVVRSYVMALAARAPFAGAWTPLANEYFATAADVHRILGVLPDGADVMATADNRGKSVAESVARLARMIGRDASDGSAAEWCALAGFFAEAQLRQVEDAARLLRSRGAITAGAPLVGAGVGTFVLRRLAVRMELPYVDFSELVPGTSAWVGACAPAVAVALLA
jgi:probable H4MPT-linked C1 transfer pathway protein